MQIALVIRPFFYFFYKKPKVFNKYQSFLIVDTNKKNGVSCVESSYGEFLRAEHIAVVCVAVTLFFFSTSLFFLGGVASYNGKKKSRTKQNKAKDIAECLLPTPLPLFLMCVHERHINLSKPNLKKKKNILQSTLYLPR